MSVIALFCDGDLSATLEAQLEKARGAVEQIPAAKLRRTGPVEVAGGVYEEFNVEPISLTEGAISVQAEEAEIDRRTVPGLDWGFPGDPQTIPGTRVIYNVPFAGAPIIFRLRPSRWTTSLPHAQLTPSELRFIYDVQSSRIAETKAAFDRDLQLTKEYISGGVDDLHQFSSTLRSIIETAINQRIARLDEASEGLAGLGLPVRSTQTVRLDAYLAEGPQATSQGGPASQSRFDVALSFAGEDRAYVEQVARHLVEAKAEVFYDDFQTVALWGKDLVEHLQDIYQNRAQFCVLFISAHYVSKPWPTHERRSALARALVAKEEYLLPARFDDSTVPGLQPTIAYVDLRTLTPKDFAAIVLAKIELTSPNVSRAL